MNLQIFANSFSLPLRCVPITQMTKRSFQDLGIHYDHKVFGERALLLMSPEGLLRLISDLNLKKFVDAGGEEAWNLLSAEEQDQRNAEVAQQMVQTFGQEAYDKLTDKQKMEADFFIWAGCCMHKDLNAHKGGNMQLMFYWPKNNLVGPIVLMNKDNAAAAVLGTSAAKN
jgi:hypothetical protein